MTPDSRRAGPLLGRAARAAARLPDRAQSAFVPVATVLGAVGLLALVGCGVIWATPEESRPLLADDESLIVAAFGALCLSSLLGWTAVVDGERRIRRSLGPAVAFVLLGLLPVVGWSIGLAHDRAWIDTSTWPGMPWTLRAAQWYGPIVILLALARHVLVRLRPRTRVHVRRGTWSTILVAPYVLLLAVLAFGAPVPQVESGLDQTLDAMGGGAIALQLLLAVFVGGPDS